MKVKLTKNWFAPTDPRQVNAIFTTSGRRYRPGVHEMPESLRPFLPKTAVILSDKTPVDTVVASGQASLRDYDESLALENEVAKRLEQLTIAKDKQPKNRLAKEMKE